LTNITNVDIFSLFPRGKGLFLKNSIANGMQQQLIFLLVILSCGIASFFNSCKKEQPIASTEPKDAEGYLYPTARIGNRTWFTENLKTRKYRNGNEITFISAAADWAANTTGALRESRTASSVGYLYNYAALSDSRGLCPNGWRIPSQADFEDLKTAAGGGAIAGFNLKTNTSDWSYPNELNININNPDSLGFTALPNGYVQFDGTILGNNTVAAFWTTTESSSSRAKSYELYANDKGMSSLDSDKRLGLSCRCVKD